MQISLIGSNNMSTLRCRLIWGTSLLLAGCAQIPLSPEHEENAVTIDRAVTTIQVAIGTAEEDLEGAQMQLTAATLTLNTSATRSSEGKAEVFIVGGGGSNSSTDSDKVTVSLKPIYGQQTMNVDQGLRDASTELAMAIASTIDGVSNSRSGQLPLIACKLSVEQYLEIKTTKSVGGEFEVEVIPVTLGSKSSKSTTRGHKLVLTIEPLPKVKKQFCT